MENNKLIAEFMGANPFRESETEYSYEMWGLLECLEEGDHEKHFYLPNEMRFNESWDWLMPVVQKCYETEVVVQPAVEGGCSGLITFPLIGLPYMESTYNAVVKFIKEYNVDNADSEDDACDMLYGVDNNQ